jgi:amino acid transporter
MFLPILSPFIVFQWAVEVGTPLFIVYLMTALYCFTGLGVYIIRIRGDLKENEKYAKNERLFKILKIAHAVVMITAWVIVLSAACTSQPWNFDLNFCSLSFLSSSCSLSFVYLSLRSCAIQEVPLHGLPQRLCRRPVVLPRLDECQCHCWP